jgi:hypothetical protein
MSELRRVDVVRVLLVILPLAEVETLQLRVVDAGEAHVKRALALRNDAIESDDGEFVLGVERDDALEALALLGDEGGAVDLEVCRVQNDAVGRVKDFDLHFFTAGELVDHLFVITRLGRDLDAGSERDLVVDGLYVLGQTEFLLLGHGEPLTVKHAHI